MSEAAWLAELMRQYGCGGCCHRTPLSHCMSIPLGVKNAPLATTCLGIVCVCVTIVAVRIMDLAGKMHFRRRFELILGERAHS